MRKSCLISISALALLGGCGQSENDAESMERVATYDMAEPPAAPMAPRAAAEIDAVESATDTMESSGEESTPIPGTSIPVGLPQIAYSFTYGFRLPAAAIKPLQERHADMCEAKGPNICRIVSMEQAEDEGDYSEATLSLAVASPLARRFGKDLVAASDRAEGKLVASSIDGEDLSKQIVDTEARLRARRVLRDRLMEVLETRKGTVAELVEAERSVAAVNEEIDQATSWLSEMKARVAFSTMTITYQSGAPSAGGFTDPIRAAWGSIGSILGGMIAFLILAATLLVPLGLLLWLLVQAWRRLPRAAGSWLPPRADTAAAE